MSGLPGRLSNGGRAIVIGSGLSDGVMPLFAEDLEKVAVDYGLCINVCIVNSHPCGPGSKILESLAMTATAASGHQDPKVIETLTRMVTDAGGTHLCYFDLWCRSGTPTISITDLSPSDSDELWFV